MTLAEDFQGLEVDLAALFGQSVVLTHITASTYAASGTVTNTQADHTLVAEGPVSEARRYSQGSDERVTATFYLPAASLTVVPANGDRITVASRIWQVIAVETFQVQGSAHAYRCDCGEVA